ncbi:uncharacterized protein LOC117177132 [Belonocnema kinseyi]|uniref:uncharacterized protein LOC117177132 n=1 Tax=Belonocnema kinseyi TaxID=2817044 RepID=UPI00143CF4F3|nr:uncharacterized protein LOC117177132 [Belonocnema kinseyi]
MTEKLEIVKGQKFSSYEELKKFVEEFQKCSKQRFRKQRSKYIAQAHLRKEFKKELVYYEMEFVCIHGGIYRRRGSGIRETRTLCTNCPSFFKLRASQDGTKLEVKSLNMVHENHGTIEDPLGSISKMTRVSTCMLSKNKNQNAKEELNESVNDQIKSTPPIESLKEEKASRKFLEKSEMRQGATPLPFCVKQLRQRAIKEEFLAGTSNSDDEGSTSCNSDNDEEEASIESKVTDNANNNNHYVFVEYVPNISVNKTVKSESEDLKTMDCEQVGKSFPCNQTRKSIATQTNSKIYSIEMFRTNNNAILFYTGLESYEKFKAVYKTLEPNKPPFLHYQGDVTSIGKEDQLFLTLMKLWRNTEDYELSLFFGISKMCVFNVLITWINFMHQMWSMTDWWPSEEFIIFYMPKLFKQYYPSNKFLRDVTRIAQLHEDSIENDAYEEDLDMSSPGNRQLASDRIYVKKLVNLTKRFKILRKSLKMCYAPLGQKVYEICLMMCNFTEDPNT